MTTKTVGLFGHRYNCSDCTLQGKTLNNFDKCKSLIRHFDEKALLKIMLIISDDLEFDADITREIKRRIKNIEK